MTESVNQSAAKKTAPAKRSASAKRVAAKKSAPAKRATAKQAAAKKTAAKKTAAKRSAPAKKLASATAAVAVAASKPAASTAAASKPAPAKKTASARTAAALKEAAARRVSAERAVDSRFFKRAIDQARNVANDPEKLREIAHKANHSAALRGGPFAAVLEDFAALIRLVVAYARGLYRQIPLEKLILVVGGLLYVVSPIDMVPDAIPIAGFLDDATVVAWVIKAVRDELDAFREWEAGLKD